jgi:hypothetical protein
LRLSAKNQSTFLDRLKIASVSFSFHVQLSDTVIDLILREEGLTRESPAPSIDQALNNRICRIIAAQHATFESSVYYGSEVSGFKHKVLTSAKTTRATNGWTARSEWALDAYLASAENQAIESITLTNKTERNTFYTISLASHNRARIRRSLEAGGYANLMDQVERDGGHSIPVEDRVSQLANTLTITVTAHPRVLDNNMGIHSGSDLRDYIAQHCHGSVEDFAKELIRASFDKSGLTYWNGTEHWEVALADKAAFDAMIAEFAEQRVIKGKFATVSDSRWDFIASLPRAIDRDDEDTYFEMRRLATKVGKLERGVRAFASGKEMPRVGVTAIPEFSVALLCYWFKHGSEMSWDIFKNSDLLPHQYKVKFFANKANEVSEDGKQTVQGQVGVLLADCKQFILDNFGVNIEHSKDLHREVHRKRSEALFGRRARYSRVTVGELSNATSTRLLTRDLTSTLLTELIHGQMFNKTNQLTQV